MLVNCGSCIFRFLHYDIARNAITAFQLNQTPQAIILVIIILIIGLGNPILNIATNLLREVIAQRMERDTRHEFYMNLLGKSQSFHDQQRVGNIMARTADDVRSMNFLISPALSLIIEAAINLIIPIILIAIYYPPQLLIIPVCFAITFLLYFRGYLNSLSPVTQQVRREFGLMDASLNESLSGIDLVKAMAREGEEKRKYLQHASLYKDGIIQEGKIQSKYLPLLLVAIVVTAGLGQALVLSSNGVLNLGNIISYLGLLVNLRFPIQISIWAFTLVRVAQSSAERLLEIMNTKNLFDQNASGVQKSLRRSCPIFACYFHVS